MPLLQEARAARALSRRALARRAGVGESTVYRIEAGKTRPRPHVVRRLSAALRVRPAEVAEFRPVLDEGPEPAFRARIVVVRTAAGDEELLLVPTP